MASDLLLIAVRYVAGDLPAGETAAFEARLASDQDAREAVAQAVELGAAVVQLTPVASSGLLSPHRRRGRPVALAAAAVLALAAGLALWPRVARRSVPVST